MEWTTSDLLDEYRRADFTKRLHLYLQYPELRAEFTEMDRKDLHPQAKRSISGFACTSRLHVGTLFNVKPGYVKRLLGLT